MICGRGVVDSVEIETAQLEGGNVSINVEEVWWTLSRLKHEYFSFRETLHLVEEVWWTLSRLKQRISLDEQSLWSAWKRCGGLCRD